MAGLRIREHKVPCPFCGKLIPEPEIDEHIKIHVEEESAPGFSYNIRPGEMLKVVYGRYAWYVLVTNVRMMPIVQGRDVYGNEVKLDLRKAMMIVKLTPEQAQEVLRRTYQRRKKKREQKTAEGEVNVTTPEMPPSMDYSKETEKRQKETEEVEKSEEQPDRS